MERSYDNRNFEQTRNRRNEIYERILKETNKIADFQGKVFSCWARKWIKNIFS